MTAAIRTAITAIPEDAWTAIAYPQAVWDDQLDCWVSDAEIAGTTYTAFTSKKKELHVTARLIVRRVRDKAKAAPGQGELFPAWRYHAIFTDSPYGSPRLRSSTAATPSSSSSSPTSTTAPWPTCRSLSLARRLLTFLTCWFASWTVLFTVSRPSVNIGAGSSLWRVFRACRGWREDRRGALVAEGVLEGVAQLAVVSSRARMRVVAASRRRSRDAVVARCRSGICGAPGACCWRVRSRSICLRRSSWA